MQATTATNILPHKSLGGFTDHYYYYLRMVETVLGIKITLKLYKSHKLYKTSR